MLFLRLSRNLYREIRSVFALTSGIPTVVQTSAQATAIAQNSVVGGKSAATSKANSANQGDNGLSALPVTGTNLLPVAFIPLLGVAVALIKTIEALQGRSEPITQSEGARAGLPPIALLDEKNRRFRRRTIGEDIISPTGIKEWDGPLLPSV